MKLLKQTRGWVQGLSLAAALALTACGGGASSDLNLAAGSTSVPSVATATTPTTPTTPTTTPTKTPPKTPTATLAITPTATPTATPIATPIGTPTPTPTPTPPSTTTTTSTGTISSQVFFITVYYTAVESFHTDVCQDGERMSDNGMLVRQQFDRQLSSQLY